MCDKEFKHKIVYTTIVKRAKNSEKAYCCLKIAWLYSEKAETLDEKMPNREVILAACKEQEEVFYKQAYDGFMKAILGEKFSICGMDQNTMDYLLAYMSAHFKRYDIASKCISNILASSASNKIKDKARDLKEQIIAELKKER